MFYFGYICGILSLILKPKNTPTKIAECECAVKNYQNDFLSVDGGCVGRTYLCRLGDRSSLRKGQTWCFGYFILVVALSVGTRQP